MKELRDEIGLKKTPKQDSSREQNDYGQGI